MKQCEETLTWYYQQQDMELKQQDEERILLLERLIVFLPPVRQRIMALHYLNGDSPASIAASMEITAGRVIDEMMQGLDFLRKITAALQHVPEHRRVVRPRSGIAGCCTRQEEGKKIFHMRHHHKLTFSVIAHQIGHSKIYVHQTFIQMHAWLHQLRQTG